MNTTDTTENINDYPPEVIEAYNTLMGQLRGNFTEWKAICVGTVDEMEAAKAFHVKKLKTAMRRFEKTGDKKSAKVAADNFLMAQILNEKLADLLAMAT